MGPGRDEVAIAHSHCNVGTTIQLYSITWNGMSSFAHTATSARFLKVAYASVFRLFRLFALPLQFIDNNCHLSRSAVADL